MSLSFDDLMNLVKNGREHFLKHIHGIRDDQWDWKPYVECKSPRETLLHLLGNDKTALHSLQTGKAPDWAEFYNETERDIPKLLALMSEARNSLIGYLTENYADKPLGTEIIMWGETIKLGLALAAIPCEDYYHAGQIAFIRQATDHTWDYYAAIYEFGG